MPHISVAKLNPDDRNDWQQLLRGYLEFYDRSWDDSEFDRAWTALQCDERVHALGAKIDGELVGIAQFLEHGSTTGADMCYLQDLFTDPAARGQGIATALIKAVVNAAREQGCGRVYWLTQDSNKTARSLYDKLAVNDGFIRYQIPI